MVKGEKDYQPSPDDLEKLKSSIDILVERGSVREDVRSLLNTLQDGNSWGLPDDQVSGSIRALKGFLSRPYLFPEDVQELMGTFEQEKRFARINWEEKRKKAARIIKGSMRVSLAAVGLFASVMGARTLGDWRWQIYDSPEAIAASQLRESARAAKKQQEADILERESTLGLEWTVASEYSWALRYLPPDSNLEYESLNTKGSSGLFSSGSGIVLSSTAEDELGSNINLRMIAYTFQRSDGKIVPQLRIVTPHGQENADVLLRTESTSEIDARVLQAYDRNLKRERFLKIEVAQGGSALKVDLMKPVRKA